MIGRFQATSFRCLQAVDLELSPEFNLIVGPNASGKTSFLEALAYLGRGKSFRGAGVPELIRHGDSEFILFGEVDRAGRPVAIGVRNGREGLEIRIGGESASGAAALAEALPLQVIDPEVHNLVAGGPDLRRRFLDWIAFHVEPEHLKTWRRYRRVLKQRNAALRSGSADSVLRSWDSEFITAGAALDSSRRDVLEITIGSLQEFGEVLLQTALDFEYRSGWVSDKPLDQALAESSERERQHGATQVGPHRADIKIRYDERQAKKLVSRGQQKLLASAMILAATETAQTALEKPLLLLLDDPAAELDSESVARLMGAVGALGSQVVATTLVENALAFTIEPAVFHVEQGRVSPAPL